MFMIPLVFVTALNLAILAAADLGSDFSGAGIEDLFPGSARFEGASRAYNRRFTFTPSAVAYPKSAEEVSKVVTMGGKNGMKVIARSGGHSYIANGLGGKNGTLVVDMSNMKGLTVDSASNVATIETGNRLGNVAVGLNEKKRALPHGTCPYVGIGGHSAFGGFGYTSRMWGLTMDTIQAVNTVLANGTKVRVTKENHPDLFFALRGAAPSFGITTSIEVETFSVPTYSIIFSYTWDLDAQTASQALLDFQTFATNTTDLPLEFGGGLTFSKGSTQGKVGFTLIGGWYGSQGGKLDEVLAPLLGKMPKPTTSDRLGNGTYIDSVKELGGGLDTSKAEDTTDTFYARSLMTPVGEPLSADAARAFTKYLSEPGWKSDTAWFMQVELYGGPNSKVNAVPVDESAFVRRDTLFTWQLYASSSNNEPPYPEEGFTFVNGAVDSIVKSMPSNWDYSAYTNYIDDRLDNWQKLYYGNHYDRLRNLKSQFDPGNVFVFPTSVEGRSGDSGNRTGNGTSGSDSGSNNTREGQTRALGGVIITLLTIVVLFTV
ncbi:hypothetical protein AAF712_015607 [Marasmius tenuissimus]|uniref:FAD-binding PCMH-type domain-containing protein n=1 Tax=Marasmius tenuissimus TaxID=585030 RepID=A0ABR2Z914_9AGAR